MRYIVSEQHRFVYLVTQKVACSSIKLALLPLFPIDEERYAFINRFGVRRVRVHKAYEDAGVLIRKEDFVADFDRFEPMLRFGFVRNPWDRLVSCYAQKLHSRKSLERSDGAPLRPPFGDTTVFRLGMPFEEFVEAVHGIPDSEADAHFRSQTGVLYETDSGGRCLANFIGRFERLSVDFARLAAVLGAGDRLVLPHELKSRTRKGRAYQAYYDDRTRRLVEERYAADCELFQYRFEELPSAGVETC
jgi:hypothetical protein